MNIIKIGGGRQINTEGIIIDLAAFKEKFIIIHGANAFRDDLAERLGVRKKVITSVKGYSSVYSDEDSLDVMMMAYSGLRNKRIVESCQKKGINAIGLTGLDGRMIQGARNQGIRVREDGKLRLIRDFSGKPKSVNTGLLNLLLDNNYIPVLTVPITDEEGFAINSENDDIIASINDIINAKRIFQFIEAPGYLKNPMDESSVIKYISKHELAALEETSEGRMKRKIHALNKLAMNNETEIIISDGRVEHPLNDAINGKGTIIK
ncbi:MAG: [LysW]-aminoadipate kinase [Melioribacteraceae bacterium]|nr:[LysW]-aminoadipate kinase [Melioribacteraceae bacterium]